MDLGKRINSVQYDLSRRVFQNCKLKIESSCFDSEFDWVDCFDKNKFKNLKDMYADVGNHKIR